MPASEGKYGELTTTGKQFHPGEPVFVLRATDPLTPTAIMDYAARCFTAGCSESHLNACVDQAQRVRDWQAAHPELVKERPD